MSFGFQFDEDELDEEYRNASNRSDSGDLEKEKPSIEPSATKMSSSKGTKHTLKELLSALPPRISYSSLTIPLKGSDKVLYRRDLFDARFQLVNDDQEDNLEDQRFAAGTQTDLIPGIYEGGFKTWECAIDLVIYLKDCIEEENASSWLTNIKLTELGCGTALPSMYVFSEMLSNGESQVNSSLILCDFNEQVLRLVTLPNMFLTWYFHHNSHQAEPSGEIEIMQETIEDFETTLKNRGINLDFYSGSWDGLDKLGAFDNSDGRANIVLTSETIYSMKSLPILVDALHLACSGSIESTFEKVTLVEMKKESKSQRKNLCLVAAKVLYFGVGGGVTAFNEELQRRRANSKIVWSSGIGVSRLILQVEFDAIVAAAAAAR